MLRKIDYVFIAAAVAIVLFFLAAPPESTIRTPCDDEHQGFNTILRKEGKKAVEKLCDECHSEEAIPLSKDHPPKYRCLFCHKLTPPPEKTQPEKTQK